MNKPVDPASKFSPLDLPFPSLGEGYSTPNEREYSTIEDMIEEGVFHGKAGGNLPASTHNDLLAINGHRVNALAEKILLAGGTKSLTWDGEGKPDFGKGRKTDVAVYHAADDILKVSKFSGTEHEDGLRKLVVQKAIAVAQYYEKTVPEFTRMLADASSTPGQKGVTVTLNQGLVNEFEKNTRMPDWFKEIASKHYNYPVMGGNFGALGGRAMSIAATNIDPEFKTDEAYAMHVSSLVGDSRPWESKGPGT